LKAASAAAVVASVPVLVLLTTAGWSMPAGASSGVCELTTASLWAAGAWGAASLTNSAMGTCSTAAGVLLPQLHGAYHDP